MGGFLVVIAVIAPLIGATVASLVRRAGLGAGRSVAIGCGIGSVAAIGAVIASGLQDDGIVGDFAGLGLYVDRATALLLAVVTTTGVVVASFARRNLDLDPRAPRFFGLFGVLVTGSALVVVPGGATALVAGWLASSWALIGLVGHRNDVPATRRAQRKAAASLVIGDVALLLAVVVAVAVGGSPVVSDVGSAFDELRSTSWFGVGTADLVGLLLVVAGASRSALVPFHRWLVTTLAAPTPVSALVHAGFVSGAGLLLVRFGPLVLTSSVAVHLMFALAVATIAVAIGAGATRTDVKGKLAWSTVAQMGFMVVQCTVGAFSSAVFHIAGHGMYKASLFLGAGDAVTAGLRSSRRASPLPLAPASRRLTATMIVSTLITGGALLALTPDVNDAGTVLIAVFAWLTVAHGVWGWLERGVSPWPRALAECFVGGLVGVLAYLGGLRLVERFVKPTFGEVVDAGVGAATLLVTLGLVVAAFAITRMVPGATADRLRTSVERWLVRTAHPGVAGDVPLRSSHLVDRDAGLVLAGVLTDDGSDGARRSQIRADVARAGNVIAPTWPLSSVVAVNPLGGLEPLGFEQATTVARQQLHARTHLTLPEFQRDHAAGATTVEDVRWAIETCFFAECAAPPIEIADREILVAELIEADMLYGPEVVDAFEPRTAVERIEGSAGRVGGLIDVSICHSVAQYVARTSHETGFFEQWRSDAISVSELRRHLTLQAVDWLRTLTADAANTIDAAFAVLGVADGQRIAEMRGHLSCLQGWAGYAKWRTEWAHPDEHRPKLSLIELVAARSALEAACVISGNVQATPAAEQTAPVDPQQERTAAIAAALGVDGEDAQRRIGEIVSMVSPFRRNEAWLRAQERHVDQGLLTVLDRLDPGPPLRDPEAQLVFCIDVRSEGLRRHIEAVGPYDTLGFAGFFGVPMSIRRVEWDHSEARCPVLVTPSAHAVERPTDQQDPRVLEQILTRDRQRAGANQVHARTKSGVGAPFVMAEAAGWIAGPRAAIRTLLPSRTRSVARPPTMLRLQRNSDAEADLEQRTFIAEAVLTTMGLTRRFAPLVVLCGHASHNVNNPHATALDCGACAGASGQDNARAVADLLNDADVRHRLRDRTIEIPDSTTFVAALHETVTDSVALLDRHLIPAEHHERLDRLAAALDVAGTRQSAARAAHLPGPERSVRRRGTDWAQVRPEWGLARNAAFIIGPRSMTSGLDLDGRAFLHTYDPDSDPDGKVLETIMTAPLVVAHWISSQYYFSTVDPERFGAGDKLVHNVIGTTCVISGEHGDLRVGLPNQSTHLGAERHHQPVRLVAAIQAPLERVERIIQQNSILSTLTAGSWLRIAGRSHPHERWSLRTPSGTWNAEPRPIDPITATSIDLTTLWETA